MFERDWRHFARGGGRAFIATLCLVLVATAAVAQLGRGRMQGTVTDEEGNPLAGVKITAHNPEVTPSTLESTTDERGRWAIMGFTSATWQFAFELDGYLLLQMSARVQMLSKNADMDVELTSATPEAAAMATGVGEGGGGLANMELFEEGEAAFEAGEYSVAAAKWEEFLLANPDVYQVNVNIGNAYREAGDNSKAMAAFQLVLDHDPTDPRANFNMAEVLVHEGETDEAMIYFERVIQSAPDDPAVYYNVAELYFAQRVAESAIEYYNRALAVQPDYLPALKQLGFAQVNAGQVEGAITTFEKFVELAPEDHPDAPLIKDVLVALKSSSGQGQPAAGR